MPLFTFFTCIHCDTITPSTLDCSSEGVVGHEKLLDSKVISPERFGLNNLAKTGLQLSFQMFGQDYKINICFRQVDLANLSAHVSVLPLVLFIQYLVNQFAFQKI